ncbi:MAG TPA: protein-disulfide reductase DsbD domain-containing protein, partial [Pyrinomonadaceae bacterium]|nr:protein-disulfide reductase DsbD domain-containing protein [Pyrinomonadaceae bacterium]
MPTVLFAQNPAKWSLDLGGKTGSVKSGESLKAVLQAEIEPGWHLYATDQPEGGPIPTTIKVTEAKQYKIDGEIASPQPKVKPDPNFQVDGKPLETKYFELNAKFTVPVAATNDTRAEDLSFDVRFQLCNDTFCLPPKTWRISTAGSEEVKRTASSAPKATAAPESSLTSETPEITRKVNNADIWGFVWLAATLGLLSLLTPCVFPMIPITVSYFTNHSSG